MPCCARRVNQRKTWSSGDTYPESAGRECNHAASESRFLAFRGDALVHALSQPHVCLLVPRVEEDLEVGWELDDEDVDVRRARPQCFPGGSNTGETETRQNAGTLAPTVRQTRRNCLATARTSVSVQMA